MASTVPLTASVQAELAQRLAEFARGLNYEDLPRTTVAHIKLLLLDQLAVTISGSSAEGIERLVKTVASWGGATQATVAMQGCKLPIQGAALVNAAMARARDFDAVHEGAILHVTAGCIPALLAAAERDGQTTGRQFIAASAVAMETMIRLLQSVKTNFLDTGRIASVHCTNFATALGVSKLLGLPKDAMVSALGIAGSQVSGSMQPMVEGSELVRIQQGLVAHSGVMAALLAEGGTQGPLGVFDGAYGYFRSYHNGQYDRARIEADLGQRFELEEISTKFYPCCFLNHSAIEAVIALRRDHQLAASDVAGIVVRTTTGTYNTTCAPRDKKQKPQTSREALFSMPFALGLAMQHGEVRAKHFTDNTPLDGAALELATRVETQIDGQLDKEFPVGVPPSSISITLRNGHVLSKRIDFVKGNPRNPMSMDEMRQKISDCNALAAKPLPDHKLKSIIGLVDDLENLADVSVLGRCLASELSTPREST